MKLLITAAAIVLSASAAYAQVIMVTPPPPKPSDPYGTEYIENVPVKQNPFDIGRMNESPIRGKGQIRVEHNAPAPGDPDRKLHDARWLMQDNGWTCSKPTGTRR